LWGGWLDVRLLFSPCRSRCVRSTKADIGVRPLADDAVPDLFDRSRRNQLLLFRTLAGMGGGGLAVTSSVIVSDLVPLKKRGLYQGCSSPALTRSSHCFRYVEANVSPGFYFLLSHQPPLWPRSRRWCSPWRLHLRSFRLANSLPDAVPHPRHLPRSALPQDPRAQILPPRR
jgi:hypothetical protein